MRPIRFTGDEAQAAADEWGFNCGPGALCAVLNKTPAEIRPHLLDFEAKGYTNPTLMLAVLRTLQVEHSVIYKSNDPPRFDKLRTVPNFGLVRIQWAGPWTNPGVPARVRYRHSHWIATRKNEIGGIEAFDVNAVHFGGWMAWQEWALKLVPWLIRECVPKASGDWWPTHSIKIEGLDL